MSKFYNVNEVAEILNISARTVRNLCYSGEISHNKIGGQIRISQTDLETYLKETKSNLKGNENNE